MKRGFLIRAGADRGSSRPEAYIRLPDLFCRSENQNESSLMVNDMRHSRFLMLALAAALMFGCAGIPSQSPPEKLAAISRIQVIPSATQPETKLAAFKGAGEGTFQGAAAGAVGGAAGGVVAGAVTLGPIGAAIGVVLAPITAVIGAVSGATAGAIEAIPPEKFEELESIQRSALARLAIQQNFARKVAEYATDSGYESTLADPDSSHSPSPTRTERSDLRPPFNTVMETAVEQFEFTGGKSDAVVALRMKAKARLLDARTKEVLGQVSISGMSEKHPLTEWLKNDGALLEKTYARLGSLMAENIVADQLLDRWPEDVRVMRPIPLEPAGRFKLEGIFTTVSTSSLPTLTWEPPISNQGAPGPGPQSEQAKFLANVSSVRYDVRIDDASEFGHVYFRSRLSGTEHKLEEALPAGKRYRWAIRARLMINGRELVTPWRGGMDSFIVANQ